MTIIKLDAIDSTNTYLKELSQKETLKNFTVVSAKSQTNGKGQMGSKWVSESNKNLIISILIKNSIENSSRIFDLNIVVAVSIIDVLKAKNIPNLSIKWPNDIMSENKKIGGILIENSIKGISIIDSIIGFGLNVNQTYFENLPKASSLKNIMLYDFNIDTLIVEIVLKIEENILIISSQKQLQNIWKKYNELLFKKEIPTVFEDVNQNKFMGIIQKVNTNGTLNILLENDDVKSFEVKEITMLY